MAHPPSFLATQVAMFMLRLSVGPQKNQPCGNYSGTFIGHESRWMRFLRRDFFFYVSTSTQVLDNFPATSTKFPTSTKVRHAEPFNQPTNKKTTAPLGGAPLTNPRVSRICQRYLSWCLGLGSCCSSGQETQLGCELSQGVYPGDFSCLSVSW